MVNDPTRQEERNDRSSDTYTNSAGSSRRRRRAPYFR